MLEPSLKYSISSHIPYSSISMLQNTFNFLQLFNSPKLLGFDTNQPLNDYLMYTEDSRYTSRISTNQHQTIIHTLTVRIKINTVPNTY